MIPYRSRSGKQSGVTAYEIGDDFIKVRFRDSKIYTYPEALNDKETIDHMKHLATQRIGLSTFIAQNKSRLRFG